MEESEMKLSTQSGRICGLWASHAWYVPEVKGMFALFGWWVVGMVLTGIIEVILQRLLPENVMIYKSLVTDVLQYVPAIIYVFRKSRRNSKTETGYKPDSTHFGPFKGWQLALIIVVLTFAYMMANEPINYWNEKLVMLIPAMQTLMDLLQGALEDIEKIPAWIFVFSAVIYAPVFEEWLCRGMVLRGLLTRMKPTWAIVLSALFFSIIHMNPVQGANAFLLGLILGYVYYKTGSLWLTMFLHFVNNSSAFLRALLPGEDGYILNAVPMTAYAVMYVLGIVVLVACLMAFRRIPLEQKRGNIDEVAPRNQTEP